MWLHWILYVGNKYIQTIIKKTPQCVTRAEWVYCPPSIITFIPCDDLDRLLQIKYTLIRQLLLLDLLICNPRVNILLKKNRIRTNDFYILVNKYSWGIKKKSLNFQLMRYTWLYYSIRITYRSYNPLIFQFSEYSRTC